MDAIFLTHMIFPWSKGNNLKNVLFVYLKIHSCVKCSFTILAVATVITISEEQLELWRVKKISGYCGRYRVIGC